jgi:peptidyl-prolyl cis-trans isomerase C
MKRVQALKSVRFVFLCMCFYAMPPAQAQDEGIDTGAVVAMVGERQITMQDLLGAERRLRRFEQDQDDRDLLQPFIDRELLLLEARRASLDTAARVQQALDGFYRRQLAEKVYREEVSNAVSVSDGEIRQYFVDKGLDQKREVRASHILVDKPQDLEAIMHRLDAGEEFAHLARELSLDEPTADKGGDMGFWQEEDARRSAFVKQFIGVELGKIAKPYKNARGKFHLVKITEHRLLGFERQADQIRRSLERQKKQDRWLEYLAEERDRFELTVDDGTLAFLLEVGRLAVYRKPPIESVEHTRVLARYSEGEVNLADYAEMVQEASQRDRPRAVDSTAVAQFIEREVMQQVILPIVAERKGWHQAADVTDYLDEKRDQAMVEMLRRTIAEDPYLTEEVRHAYYESHQPDFIEPERIFFEGGLVETTAEAEQVLERLHEGGGLAPIMKGYPAFSEQWRTYDVFHFTTSRTPESHGARWAKAVELVRNLEPGEIGGPLELPFEDGSMGHLVVQALAVEPARVLAYDDPLVQDTVRRQTRHEFRKEISASFYSYLEGLREQYATSVVVYDNVLTTAEQYR